MGAVDIKTAVKQMNGVFGCKVSFDLDHKTQTLEYTFSRKTILDFFVDLFASAEEKSDQSANVVLALQQISSQSEAEDAGGNSELKKLVTKYTADRDLIDFKEIRRTLRALQGANFSPVVFTPRATRAIEASTDNAHQMTVDSAGPSASEPAYLAAQIVEAHHHVLKNNESALDRSDAEPDDMQEIDNFLNYKGMDFDKLIAERQKNSKSEIESALRPNGKVFPDADVRPSTAKNNFPKGFGNSESEKEEWEKIYIHKIGESIRAGTYTIELMRDVDGEVSDANLEALSGTLVAVE
jgi:hypothetical protein